jgi:Zn-dependent M28 family amino/carboxypeptidase
MMSKLQRKPKSFFQELSGFPMVYFNINVAPNLLKLSKKKFDDFINNQTTKRAKAKINFAQSINPNLTENVIGILVGSSKKQEYIFVTAHYDHLGIMDGRIYNGADDNASGTSALLELAATFAAAKKAGFAPERNIVFVAMSGEELGLLGSEFLTNNLQIPHSSIHAVYNIDMIGRASKNKKNQLELYIVGTDNCVAQNTKIVNQYFPTIRLNHTYNSKGHPEKLYYRSDHYNFARFGVKFIYFTSGFHRDYHLPSDDSKHINYEGIELITELIFRNIQAAVFSN